MIGVAGFIISLGYTAPPLRLVYRGLGEVAVAVGFGPLMLLGAYVVQSSGALAWEPFVASLPIALLVALILYVNEIPDRRGDAHAGKRTLPVRFSRETVVRGYDVAAAAAYAIVVGGVLAGLLPVPALLVLLTIPLALRVHRGLTPNYDNPYGLMAIMGINIKVHLYAGIALLLAYVVVLIAGAVAPDLPLFLNLPIAPGAEPRAPVRHRLRLHSPSAARLRLPHPVAAPARALRAASRRRKPAGTGNPSFTAGAGGRSAYEARSRRQVPPGSVRPPASDGNAARHPMATTAPSRT